MYSPKLLLYDSHHCEGKEKEMARGTHRRKRESLTITLFKLAIGQKELAPSSSGKALSLRLLL